MDERKLKIEKIKDTLGVERDCVHFDGKEDTKNILLIDWHGKLFTIIDNIDYGYMEGHYDEPGLTILYHPQEHVLRDIEIAGQNMAVKTLPSECRGSMQYCDVTDEYKSKDLAEGINFVKENAEKWFKEKSEASSSRSRKTPLSS